MTVKCSNNYAHKNIQYIALAEIANERAEITIENKIHRQRKLPRQRNSMERILSSLPNYLNHPTPTIFSLTRYVKGRTSFSNFHPN